MARKAPKNPINDIVDTVGAWFGGSRGVATNPQVRAAMDATRAIGKVVDTATGGFGQAVVSDAQRMAQSGSSTPSALYKTAAVNLGAAAAGVGAAKVGAKVAGKIASALDNRTVMLAHGGAKDLVGGRVSPSFSREVQKQLDSTTIRNLRWSIDAKNPARVTSSEETRKIQKFLKSAEKSGGFFSASATGETPAAYAVPRVSYRGKNLAGSAKSGGAVHVVKVPKKSVIRGGGESGEFLVAANPKPVKSFEFPKTYSTPGQAIEDLASQVDAFIKSKNRLKVPKRK